jgi:hypothetical protein
METMYFVLGMLSIIATTIVSVLVWGIVKINKQQLWLDSIQRQIEQASRDVQDRFVETYREIDQRINENSASMSCEFDRIYNDIADIRSYTDSRIDKVIGTTGAKQVIKG